MRVEAVIYASAEPVSRETLAQVVGKDCSIDLLIDDLIEELRGRPYELVPVAGGWQHWIRPRFAETIRASSAPTRGGTVALSEFEAMVLMAVAYFQPLTRGELSKILGKEISRDTIGASRGAGFISSGPRSPTPGAPYRYKGRIGIRIVTQGHSESPRAPTRSMPERSIFQNRTADVLLATSAFQDVNKGRRFLG